VDRFKSLNDTHGHEAGDAALRHLAKLLRRGLRERDIAARMGGEEFALWLPETALGEAEEVAERIRFAIESTPLPWKGRGIGFTCSIGVAAVPDITGEVENLYGAADTALYRAKDAGRNRVVVAVARVAD
jgi:diguanylate cyclase (GGDEF)-like protein